MTRRRLIVLWLALFTSLVALPIAPVAAQDAMPPVQMDSPPPVPVELPCAWNVSVQVLGRTPIETGQDLVLVRITWGPNGIISAHTHPGVLWVTVESGSFGFTLLDDAEMSVTRAATADSEAVQEPLMPNVEVTLGPGDGFPEMGMIHTARNLSSEESMSTIFSGVVESGQPLTSCLDEASPVAGDGRMVDVP